MFEETKKPATFATRPCEVGDDLAMVEYLGSGMPRIIKAYSRDVYIFCSRFIRTVFPKDQEALAMEKQEIADGGAIGV